MANNRMWLVHDKSGQRVLLAKHFSREWKPYPYEACEGGLEGQLEEAFKAQASGAHEDTTPWGSTGWRLEFEHHSEHDDPLQPNTVEAGGEVE